VRPFPRKYLFALSLILFSGAALSYAAEQTGTVQSGVTPIAFSTVTLYKAGNFNAAPPVVLGTGQTDTSGFFAITFTSPAEANAVLYLTADGGYPGAKLPSSGPRSSAIRLATVLGPDTVPSGIVINERTTVAAAFAMAQFISGPNIAGTSPGLQNAAATSGNLVDPLTGEVGSVLGSSPNGMDTSTMSEFNSLANLLATCVSASNPAPCLTLFALATPPQGLSPRDTLQAAVNIAHYPWQRPGLLFRQSQLLTPYSPALTSAPDAWTLAITYDGNGHEFDGPGNMAVDAKGNVWVTNNYVFSNSPLTCALGGRTVLKLTPTGSDAPGAPYRGGGLYGAGFGIAIDPKGNTWVANFGFQGVDNGTDCDPNPPPLSVSEFNGRGMALSFSTGYTQGGINQPQGTASDQQGNIWIVNCGSNSVTQYPGGNAGLAINFHDTDDVTLGLMRPFGIAIDGGGRAWIASNGNNSVVGLGPNGLPLQGSPFSTGEAPLGVAVDSLGNVWIADSGFIGLPCNYKGGVNPGGSASVTRLARDGEGMKSTSFHGGGLTVPWGIAVDGDDNVFVANFQSQRLSEFCGSRPSRCPPGLHTGDAISPAITGYSSDALTRNTGVAIDPSGNVWLANNWLNLPVQTNPGGHALVVFIGLAAPVKTPLIGPPQ
jgi:sugar lactone lactonase YvrE